MVEHLKHLQKSSLLSQLPKHLPEQIGPLLLQRKLLPLELERSLIQRRPDKQRVPEGPRAPVAAQHSKKTDNAAENAAKAGNPKNSADHFVGSFPLDQEARVGGRGRAARSGGSSSMSGGSGGGRDSNKATGRPRQRTILSKL